jgi:hypothetical protein
MALIASLGCSMAIQAQGSAAAIERHALPVLRFEKVGIWALTEPGAGSDAMGGMRTLATLDGDSLVLNGQKTFITNAPFADVFAIYARLEAGGGGERPVRAIVVERGTPGLETGPHFARWECTTLRRARSSCVTAASRAGICSAPGRERGARGAAALDALNLERAVMPAMCLGPLERCVEDSVRYARERRQFGRPIAEFQAVAFKLARMELALENARNLVFEVAWAQRAGRLDRRLASLAKLYCAEQPVRVSLDAIQVHGGSGHMTELPFEKLMRDAKMFEIGGGTNEIQLQTIARSILS